MLLWWVRIPMKIKVIKWKKLSIDKRSEGCWRFNVFLLQTMPNNVQTVISFPFFTRLAFATLPRNSLPLRILKSTKSTVLLWREAPLNILWHRNNWSFAWPKYKNSLQSPIVTREKKGNSRVGNLFLVNGQWAFSIWGVSNSLLQSPIYKGWRTLEVGTFCKMRKYLVQQTTRFKTQTQTSQEGGLRGL